jgi:hypothetical protein
MSEEIKEGYYRGRAVSGTAQFGTAKTGGEQVAFDLHVPELRRSFITVLSFAGKAGPYSLARLKACGWKGGTDLSLPGIDANEVDVHVFYESYVDGQGQTQRALKAEVVTAGFSFKAPMQPRQAEGFLANLTKQLGVAQKGAPMNQGYPESFDEVSLD